MPSTPTRFPSGVTTVSASDRLRHLGFPDPTKWQTYFNDFNAFNSGEWLATVVDTDTGGGAARTIDATGGGVLNILNEDNAADSTNLALGAAGAEPFKFVSGKKAVLLAKFSSTDVDKNFLAVMLAPISDVDLQGGLPADHFGFRVDTTDANIDFTTAVNSSATTSLAIGTVSDYAEGTNNLTEVCAVWDGSTYVELYVDNVYVGRVDASSNVPDTEVTLQLEIHNSDAAADAMAVDYVLVAFER